MMSDDRIIRDLQLQIANLTIRLEALENLSSSVPSPINISSVATPINTVTSPQINSSNSSSASTSVVRDIVVGDTVRVLNNYMGQRGLEGIVVRITSSWVFFRTRRLGVRKRKRSNLERVC